MKIKSLVTDTFVTKDKEYEVIESFRPEGDEDFFEVTVTSDLVNGLVVWMDSSEFVVIEE